MQTTEFVYSYFEAWNRHDSKAIADHLSESGTYQDMAIHQNWSRPQLVSVLDEDFEHQDYRYELFGDVLARNNTIAFQYKAVPNGGDAIAPNKAWFGAEFVTLSNDGAVKIADYYELSDLRPASRDVAGVNAKSNSSQYLKSGLSKNELAVLKLRLDRLMLSDKKYLKPDISLPELAESMGCSVNHLSQVINAGYGVNFFDFINQYRIKDAMQLLTPADGDQRTVLDVALEVGFRSTSTFYVAFRKVTSKTPAQYRKSINLSINENLNTD